MTIADMLNTPTELSFEGKTYRLRHPNQDEQGEYVRWLEQLAYDGISRRTYQDEASLLKSLRVHDQDLAAGVYDWGGEVCVRRIMTTKGLAKLVAIICRDQRMTLEIAERLVEKESRKIAAILASKVTSDPNSLRAVLATLGLPADFFSSDSATRPSAAPETSNTSADSPTTSS